MEEALNGDLSVVARAATHQMDWVESPSGAVWRKRVHRVGPAESGQVTSVVRYEPGSRFPAHDHPEGEEILVLEGVFSDDFGDWPAGTYLLNPEGFRHAPFSDPGCRLFVKLRQFAGPGRRHVAIATEAVEWSPSPTSGVLHKPLYQQDGFGDTMRLERWEPGTDLGIVPRESGAEFFVLEGAFEDENGSHPEGAWLRLPVGSKQHPRSRHGCTVYVKEGGVADLRSARDSARS